MKIISFLILFAGCAITFTACSDDPKGNENVTEPNENKVVVENLGELSYIESLGLTENEHNVVVANNTFAWTFFDKKFEENKCENVIVSPLSLSISLTMLANGANDGSQARKEILNALGYGSVGISDVNSCMMKLADGINRLDKEVELSLANSLWVDHKKLFLNSEYENILKKNFSAETYPIIRETFVADVNHWCDVRTKGMIDRLLPNNYEPQDMSLINATYFKGAWAKNYCFNAENTAKDKFITSDKTSSNVDFMKMENMFAVHSNDMMESIYLPFGSGKYNFYLVRPLGESTVGDCISALKDGNWNGFIASHPKTELLDVRLPKFDVKDEGEIRELLASMGMQYAMHESDYYFAFPTGLEVGKILHIARFRINEEGAEAAAITDIQMEGSSSGEENDPDVCTPRPFYLDHPFIYLITEKTSGAILFIGCVNKL